MAHFLPDRRLVLLGGAAGLFAGAAPGLAALPETGMFESWVNVRRFGAKGDGKAIDSPAIDRAISAVARRGGGTVYVPPGTYACYTIHLMSRVTLHLEQGATILAAAPGGNAGYDLAEPIDPAIAQYQDFGHSHWRNSLIWGEGLHDIAIEGRGLVWGKGLSRGDGKDGWLKDPSGPGTGNKAIALKNCHNVTLRDFKILEGGWFALLATGVDNLTIDNLIVDTNRDGFDIDCCRNVRVTNCTVNSPYDDGICPKSSYALGYSRITENLTIANCFVTGNYQIGSVIDGSWQKMPPDFAGRVHGRIKCGTESNGGFRNITITNCTLEDSRGIAFETVDGAMVEDITVSNIAMRGIVDAPLFLRLGKRMRGPAGRPIGTMRRILIQNITSSGATQLPSVIAGLAEQPIEDVQLNDLFLHHVGGADAAMAAVQPPENALGYPEATMFGALPSTGLFVRHARNLSIGNVDVAVARPDARPAFHFADVDGLDLSRTRVPAGAGGATLDAVRNLRMLGNRWTPDRAAAGPVTASL